MRFSVAKLITEYVGAFSLMGLGVFLIFKHHPMAGGWMVAIGLLAYCDADGRVKGGRL